MISFDSGSFHKTRDGGIYLKYEEIEGLTEELLLDYDKTLLINPRAIEYDDFLEGYLGVNLLYEDIYTPDSDNVILGCSVFNRQNIAIFDKENMCKSYVSCEPRTVIIDNAVVTGNRQIQENITGLHEGGHIWMHSEQFTQIEGQLAVDCYSGAICCRKSDIYIDNRIGTFRPGNAEMWREWQANVFAVTIALPKKSLDISINDLFKKYGVDTDALIVDMDYGAKRLAEQTIPEELRSIYNMSKESIKYRLEKTGFYKTKKKYEEEHSNIQMSLFDFIK